VSSISTATAVVYVTIFAGPEAEKRARDYFKALKGKWLKIIRATDAEGGIID
jgi:hypothetical protein